MITRTENEFESRKREIEALQALEEYYLAYTGGEYGKKLPVEEVDKFLGQHFGTTPLQKQYSRKFIFDLANNIPEEEIEPYIGFMLVMPYGQYSIYIMQELTPFIEQQCNIDTYNMMKIEMQ